MCKVASVAITVVLCVTSPALAEVTFEWVTVGNPGNAEDPLNPLPGRGSVGYVYRIAKHEVTNAQYCEFLNAVAADAANSLDGLYDLGMTNTPWGGIIRNGTWPNFTYALKPNMGNKPVNYVSFFDAMRFVNWLHNGQPSGTQDASTTEVGVYTISDGLTETRAPNAKFFIPTENEWYKAAYHQPSADGGDMDHFWLYPTKSNSDPNLATANATGSVNNPGPNVANYRYGADWNGEDGNVTSVGTAGAHSDSFYGTADQGGNVAEWNEAVTGGWRRGLRGGSWGNDGIGLMSTNHSTNVPEYETLKLGFRVAGPVSAGGVPTVSQWGMAAMALVILIAGTIVHEKRTRQLAN